MRFNVLLLLVKTPVADSVLTDFKVNAAKILSPYASAGFCWISSSVIAGRREQNAVAKKRRVSRRMISSGNGIPVDNVVIDKN